MLLNVTFYWEISNFNTQELIMKKRHQQKLVILSLGLIILLNVPFVNVFNLSHSVLGFPLFYFFVFTLWAITSCITYFILKKYSD
mgnify:CR=1 FL=1